MDYVDYYATLGVPRDATEKAIRSAFRKLARKHHPDVNPGNTQAEERFKQINEAYEVLSDPEKRQRYDELGSRWREYEQWQRAQQESSRTAGSGGRQVPFDWSAFVGQPPGGAPGQPHEYRTVSEEDLRDMFGDEGGFSDFFETLFGRHGGTGAREARAGRNRDRRARPARGADVEHPVEVTLADAYRGANLQLNLRTPGGQTRRLEVHVPPGVRTGSRVRLTGQGGPGESGGSGGDLHLVIEVRADPRFERRGDDLHTVVRAPLETLLLGGEARVPTPDGRTLALRIPPGTADGRVFRLRGQGMPHLNAPDSRGDLNAEVHVQLPERLSARQRELIDEFGRSSAATTAAGNGARP